MSHNSTIDAVNANNDYFGFSVCPSSRLTSYPSLPMFYDLTPLDCTNQAPGCAQPVGGTVDDQRVERERLSYLFLFLKYSILKNKTKHFHLFHRSGLIAEMVPYPY